MRVLLLHPGDPNQMYLMKSVCDNLYNVGIHTDMLDIHSKEFYSPRKNTFSFRRFDSLYSFLIRIPKVRVLVRKCINYTYLLCSWIVKHYDILDIQSLFCIEFVDIAKICHKKGIKIKTHIWGSDLFRESEDQKSWHDAIYKCSDSIQVATSNGAKYFSKVYPQYASRLVTIPYGLDQFDVLDSMLSSKTYLDDSFLSDQSAGRVFLTCGYNGRKEQRHMLILNAIENLPANIKQSIFLFLPMTYLLEDDYAIQIEDRLKELNIPYQIQKTRLPINQNLTMRIRTDIVINIQTTDGLAASIQEHLYCGNVLIAGNWLPYDVFLDNGIYYYKSSLDELSNSIKNVVNSLNIYKERCQNNRFAIHSLTSWHVIAPKWKMMYDNIIKQTDINS